MQVRLKHIKEQVIVITGASSGIGLVTARLAANRPEQDRQDNNLYTPARGLKERGGRAPYVSESSLHTQVSLYPIETAAMLAAACLTLTSWLSRRCPMGPRHFTSKH